jgi:hypothetical protein
MPLKTARGKNCKFLPTFAIITSFFAMLRWQAGSSDEKYEKSAGMALARIKHT